MKTVKIRLLRADDWQGLYINDELISEGHQINVIDVLLRIYPDVDFRFTNIDDGSQHERDRWDGYCPPRWLDEFEEKSQQ